MDKPKPPRDPIKTSNMTHKLETLSLLTAQDVDMALGGFEKQGMRVEKPSVEISDFTNEHIGQEWRPLPKKNGSYNTESVATKAT